MFETLFEMRIREGAGFDKPVAGKVAENQEIPVTGEWVELDGWVWHHIAGGGDLWIAEREILGDDKWLEWKGDEKDRPGPEIKALPPKTSGQFTTKGTEIYLNGKRFRFVGVNVREIAYYGFPGWHGTYTREEHIAMQLDKAKEMKAQVIRFYAPYNRNAKGEQKTDVNEAIKRVKRILDECKKRNMFALVALDDGKQSGHDVVCDYQKYREPSYRYNSAYYEGAYKNTYVPFIKKLVGELAGHKGLFAWEVCNESQVSPHPPQSPRNMESISKTFIKFYTHVTGLLRELDPQTLITTGIESGHALFAELAYEGPAYVKKLYNLPTIDFISHHSYRDKDRMHLPIGHSEERARTEAKWAKTYWKKPIVMEECGPSGLPENERPNRTDGGIWMRNFMNVVFDLGFSGVMQWGFEGTTVAIGVGDRDAGMHNHMHNVPGRDWADMFAAYKERGDQYWVS